MKLTLKHALAAIVLVLNFAIPVVAGPFEDAVAALGKGDYATALRLIRPLAEQGYPGAQNSLGIMYEKGRGVPQDYAEALKWYRKAAEQGNAGAEYNLGAMHQNGLGVTQNYVEAVRWYRRAADQGLAGGQFVLGGMYQIGIWRLVPKDIVRAYMWFNLAAAQGLEGAEKYRDEVAQHMTPAQIAEAQKLAREWKPTAQPSR
jgi:TPR repeat protein